MSVTVHHGDCLDVLRGMAEASVDSVVTDPPYGLSFMGRGWDHGVPGVPFWTEVLRVMKPGAHLVAFGGTRTYHRLACAIEDAGFEVRDRLAWITGQGFPKNHDFAGMRDEDGARVVRPEFVGHPQAEGFGTALKPSHEPIVLARKPLACPTVAAQVLATGTGALNVDGCRVGIDESERELIDSRSGADSGGRAIYGSGIVRAEGERFKSHAAGRWPPNLCHDGSPQVLEAFAAFGERTSGSRRAGEYTVAAGHGRYNDFGKGDMPALEGSFGTAARFFPALGFGEDELRFFYSAKASKADRAGSKHPTVKPVALMRWLCRLVTPPSGVCLDPFAGSGTTGEAALREGFAAVLIEREAEYVADIRARLARHRDEALLLAEAAA